MQVLHESAPPYNSVGQVCWSKDGSRIAFVRNDDYTAGSDQLCVIDAQVGATPQVVAARLRYPTWSPDGTKLAVQPPGKYQISTVDVATGTTQVISSTRQDFWPDWRRF